MSSANICSENWTRTMACSFSALQKVIVYCSMNWPFCMITFEPSCVALEYSSGTDSFSSGLKV